VKDVEIFSKSLAENIMVNPDSVEFEYKGAAFRVNILGKHYIENLLSAIIVAEKLGMTLPEIQKAVSSLDPRSKYLMRKQEGVKGAVFINDSYSANPTGVIAALEYMEDAYPEYKKILVFPGIEELGKNSKEVHRKIWKKADDVCHFAFILQQEDKEIRNKYQKCNFVFEKDFDKMKKEVKKRLGADSVVLFESRGAGVVMKKLLEDKKKEDA
jgi:UDP-N-acetylmuramoyl-tripeptide--D-alanyl-D-alanine ligase